MKYHLEWNFQIQVITTFLAYDLIDIISSHMDLQLVYELSMSTNKPFECYDLLISLTKGIKFMITYILQYEIPLQVNFLI